MMTTDLDPKITAAHEALKAKFAVLKLAFPEITFGYIGNCGVDRSGAFDDRRWYIFLPHPGRVGESNDRVGGYSTASLENMNNNWERLVIEVARKMENR